MNDTHDKHTPCEKHTPSIFKLCLIIRLIKKFKNIIYFYNLFYH
jgi:hypothetical protein